MKNPIGWIEVPVQNMDRAIQFYNSVFGWDLKVMEMGPLLMAWFPSDEQAIGASGSLVCSPDHYETSDKAGPLVYFTCDGVQKTLDKAISAGAKLLIPVTQISEDVGFMSVVLDSESNRIALHSKNA